MPHIDRVVLIIAPYRDLFEPLLLRGQKIEKHVGGSDQQLRLIPLKQVQRVSFKGVCLLISIAKPGQSSCAFSIEMGIV